MIGALAKRYLALARRFVICVDPRLTADWLCVNTFQLAPLGCEIPTPRWTAFDAVKYGLKMGAEVPMAIQERAYTSPIWYSPKN
jgi:Protein of unknown function (DUF3604)